jgi:hypothetical protein
MQPDCRKYPFGGEGTAALWKPGGRGSSAVPPDSAWPPASGRPRRPRGETIAFHGAAAANKLGLTTQDALAALADDYARMVEYGLLLDVAEPSDELLARCQAVQDSANAG